jgi:hypothetical protein
MILDNATHSLKISTSSTSEIEFDAQIVQHDITTGQGTTVSAVSAITTATTTTVITGSASYKTQIRNFTLTNSGSTYNEVTVLKDISGTTYQKFNKVGLYPGESVFYSDTTGFTVGSTSKAGKNGNTIPFLKTGTAKEGAGIYYSYSKDAGLPGAWAVGTPGLAGRATDGTLAADNGVINKPDPAAGNRWYLTGANFTGVSANEAVEVVDYLWVNSGIAVATTTAQTINSVAFPARDVNEATAGEEVIVAMLVTTATTNASAFSNMTMSYTNSAGVAGRTATVASFPATAVAGTVVYFLLQAGDSGVQSIQSLTLGTSLVGGAVSLVALRKLLNAAAIQAGSSNAALPLEGIKLPNRHCLMVHGLLGGATANTISAAFTVVEKAA